MNPTEKLDITKDSFVFSINQAYEARIQNDGSFKSHLKYEPFLEKTWKLPELPDIHSFKKSLSEIIEHHYKNLPNYRKKESVNLENISWFSHSLAALFADMEFLIHAYTGMGFPILPESRINRSNSSKAIACAIKKYVDFKNSNPSEEEKFSLLPLEDENQEALDAQYTQEMWSLVTYYAKRFFGEYLDLVTMYIFWKYVAKEQNTEVVDWNVRPPCGELYVKQFKHLFERDYKKNGNSKFNGNGKGNSGKFNGNGNGNGKFKSSENSAENPAVETIENQILESSQPNTQVEMEKVTKPSPKFSNQDKGNRRNDRNDFNNRKDRPRRTDKESFQNQDELAEKALKEVEVALKKLQKNVELTEIELAPQNSFLRRQQHMLISEAGFDTESRGEGDGRCVCIKRK